MDKNDEISRAYHDAFCRLMNARASVRDAQHNLAETRALDSRKYVKRAEKILAAAIAELNAADAAYLATPDPEDED